MTTLSVDPNFIKRQTDPSDRHLSDEPRMALFFRSKAQPPSDTCSFVMLDNGASHSSPIITARARSYLKPLSQNPICNRFINRTRGGFWQCDEYGFIFKAWKQAFHSIWKIFGLLFLIQHMDMLKKKKSEARQHRAARGTFREWAEWDRRSGFRTEEGRNMALKCFTSVNAKVPSLVFKPKKLTFLCTGLKGKVWKGKTGQNNEDLTFLGTWLDLKIFTCKTDREAPASSFILNCVSASN